MEFWKDHFTILNCLILIDNAWTQVTYRTLNSAWKKLWPDSVAERDFESDDSALIDGVVSMGKSMGLKVERDDIHEHLKSHKIELNTEELKHLHEEQQKTLADDPSSDEDEVRESVPSSLIKEMCAKWWEMQLLVETYHPDTMTANMAVHSLNDIAMMHFRMILQRRQQQFTLNKFLVKEARKATAEEEESAGSKRQRREKRQEESCPVFLWRGTPLMKVCWHVRYKITLITMHYYCILPFCILICFINTPRFQIICNCIDVCRHWTERINRLLTISYEKHFFTFRTNQLSTRFFERITFDIWGSTVQPPSCTRFIRGLFVDMCYMNTQMTISFCL